MTRTLIIFLASLMLMGCTTVNQAESLNHKYSTSVLLRTKNEAAWIASHLLLGAAVLTEKETVIGYGNTAYEATQDGLQKCREKINQLKQDLICSPSQSVPTKWYLTELAEIKNQKGPAYDRFVKEKDESVQKLIEEDKIRNRKLEEEQRQSRLNYLENKFGNKCSKNKNNNVEYNKCLNDQEQIVKKEKAIQEAKQAEENKKKQLITEKQKAEEERANRLLAGMKPEERRAYICEKTYGFRKGSDKFSECVYKILAADVELEKMELQKKLVEAQLETAKANEAAARANASRNNTPSYDPNVAAAMERANEIERGKILLNLSQALRTPAPPQVTSPFKQPLNCRLNPINNRISCY